jgi:hypothetical protein
MKRYSIVIAAATALLTLPVQVNGGGAVVDAGAGDIAFNAQYPVVNYKF